MNDWPAEQLSHELLALGTGGVDELYRRMVRGEMKGGALAGAKGDGKGTRLQGLRGLECIDGQQNIWCVSGSKKAGSHQSTPGRPRVYRAREGVRARGRSHQVPDQQS